MSHEHQKASVAAVLADAAKNCRPVLTEARAFNAEVTAQSEARRDEANDSARTMMRGLSQRRY